MNRIAILLILLTTGLPLSAQIVRDVAVEQVGQTVHISYYLQIDNPVEIQIGLSYDGGKTISRNLQKLSGDAGKVLVSGKKKVVWSVLDEIPELVGDNISFVVEANLLVKNSTPKEVRIGTQVWMSENLNVDRFRNGEIILHAQSVEEWKRAGEQRQPAWCYYDNDPANAEKYGRLYNWYAVADRRGLCPAGWHVPSDEEWTILIDFLGGTAVAGSRMKSTKGWSNGGNGSNVSGFSGLPGGSRSSAGTFSFIGEDGNWWSSAAVLTGISWPLTLDYSKSNVIRFVTINERGFSVRCLRD